MRTEKEMFDLILETAKKDDRIRAVLLQGSRTNLHVKKDIFQDYDVVYVVLDTQPFIADKTWIKRFGDILYMQYPEESTYFPSDTSMSYGWLMQFCDGNRLDLHVSRLPHVLNEIKSDTLCQVLLDKDQCLPNLPPSSDNAYLVKHPTSAEYFETCNEFWWCLNNIAKGLWREEIPYVMDMLNDCVRPMLFRLLEWKIGFKTDFLVSVGKSGKYMYKWLDPSEWDAYLKTYPAGEIEAIWTSVFLMCDLFNHVAKELSVELNVSYNETEAQQSLTFLKHVSILPKDATVIY